jgi:phosphohistidine phosphatase
MRLYLMQHAEAEREDPRPLTEAGRESVRRVVEFLKPLRIRVSKIVHSGKLRAKQTAELVAEAFGNPPVQEATGLAPLDDPGPWAERLGAEREDVLLVGHLPHLSRLAGMLLGSDEPVRFRYAGVVCLERDEVGKWRLAWMVVPELLRA